MEIFNQNEFIIYGKGKIIYPHYQVDTDFQIEYSPYKVVLKTSKIILGQTLSIGYGKFEGVIYDTDTKVICQNICLTKYSKYQLTFAFIDDLIIGNESNFTSFKAQLFGLNIKMNQFNIQNFLVSSNLLKNFKELDAFGIKYGHFLETSELIIKSKDSNYIDKSLSLKLCKEICLLLSFILAKNIVYNRYEFFDTINSQKIINKKLINNSHGQRFIFEENLDEIIPIFYENFSNLNSNEQKCLFTSIDYLNSTSNKFLEDSILSIAQIWEILADTFLSTEINNTESIQKLRNELKSTIRTWHKDNKILDYDLNFIMSRVLNSLDWEKVIKKLENLSHQEGLNFETIGLNFKALISLRNQIAHSGRFEEIGKEKEYLEVFYSSLLGIKVLILKKLGYKGYITYFIGGIPKTKNIEYYLN
ncbi:hypothetical protein [Flavobacterium sp.]|uniref:hypothetical protein n=1 Tax=Flavobacterium sp. TaxID=239 RepID=UPI0031DFCE9C